MLIPQGMAYALLAGLPPVVGPHASTIPLVAYALFGSSRHLAVGPVAIVSLLTLSGVSQLAAPGSADVVTHAALLALMVGALQLGLGLLRAGFIVNFLSHAVISGFTSAPIVIGAAFSLLVFIWRSAYPHTAELGYLPEQGVFLPEQGVFRNVRRYPEAETFAGALVLRVDASLYFANMAFLTSKLSTLAGAQPIGREDHARPELPLAPQPSTQEALERLRRGLGRYLEGRMAHPRQDTLRRALLCASQRPFAAVHGCADPRVPPQIVFDLRLGDLFVTRVVGNITDEACSPAWSTAPRRSACRSSWCSVIAAAARRRAPTSTRKRWGHATSSRAEQPQGQAFRSRTSLAPRCGGAPALW